MLATKSRRCWYQFSLRTMLVGMAFACCLLAWMSSSNWIRQWQENRKVLAVLDETTNLVFDEASLFEIIDYIKLAHRIEIQVSVEAMPERHAPGITCHLRGVTLKAGLEQILRSHKRTYIVQDGILMVATENDLSRPGN
jgi:hypothetical protein